MLESDIKAKVAGSLEKLLKEKNFSTITVQEILDLSGVSKSTFYRYFKDKYAIVEYVCTGNMMFFESYVPGNISSLQKMHRNMMEYIYSKRELYSEIVKIEGQNSLVEVWSKAGVEIFMKIYKKKYKIIPEELIKMTEFYSGGMAVLLQNWAVQGFRESPEYMSKITYACIPEVIKKYL